MGGTEWHKILRPKERIQGTWVEKWFGKKEGEILRNGKGEDKKASRKKTSLGFRD